MTNIPRSGTPFHLGVLTLGQTPRDDVTPTLQALLGRSTRILERGGLDGLDREGLAAVSARPGEPPLETRLRSGQAIGLCREAILPRLAAAAADLGHQCDQVLLLCSGEFPALAAACPRLIQPIRILRGAVAALASHRTLGVIGPEADLEEAPAQWQPYAGRVICAAASPYGALAAMAAAGRNLAGRGADLILMDDMGFSERHRRATARAAGIPVLCATTLTARVLRELVETGRN
jgi:protein AroM